VRHPSGWKSCIVLQISGKSLNTMMFSEVGLTKVGSMFNGRVGSKRLGFIFSPESHRTKVRFMSNSMHWGPIRVSKNKQKGTKRSTGHNSDLLGQTKRGARRLDMKRFGIKKSSSFILTLLVKQDNGSRARDPWVPGLARAWVPWSPRPPRIIILQFRENEAL